MKKIYLLFYNFGEFVFFFFEFIKSLKYLPVRKYYILKQMKSIGYDSFLLIVVTSAFMGFVTAVQTIYQTAGLAPKGMIGIFIEKTTLTELGPVLIALVLSGKVGASVAAEIGSMKISEQLDALHSMSINPINFIYMPKIVAGAIVFPILTILSNFVSIISAFLLSYLNHGISLYIFFGGMRDKFLPFDLWGGLIKSLFFGVAITSVGCFVGSRTKNGAEGVGIAATATVVYSSIAILIMDFIVASAMFGG